MSVRDCFSFENVAGHAGLKGSTDSALFGGDEQQFPIDLKSLFQKKHPSTQPFYFTGEARASGLTSQWIDASHALPASDPRSRSASYRHCPRSGLLAGAWAAYGRHLLRWPGREGGAGGGAAARDVSALAKNRWHLYTTYKYIGYNRADSYGARARARRTIRRNARPTHAATHPPCIFYIKTTMHTPVSAVLPY